MTELVETTPATDDEISQYATECAGADSNRCDACFAGPAIAGCASFLCRRDVSKLLARLSILREERDALQLSLAEAGDELASARREIEVLLKAVQTRA